MLHLFIVSFILLLARTVLAQAASLPADLPTGDALGMLLQSLGGLKGATGLGIALILTQAVMLFFRTPLANFAGKYRLLIVAGLNIPLGVLTLMLQGNVDIVTALLHSLTLTSFSVFGHQLYKQVTEKPVAPAAPAAPPSTT